MPSERTQEVTSIACRMLFELYGGELSIGAIDITGLPGAVAVLVERCTHGNPDRRFQSVTDLKVAWQRLTKLTDEAAEEKELQEILAAVTVETAANGEQLRRLIELLLRDSTSTAEEKVTTPRMAGILHHHEGRSLFPGQRQMRVLPAPWVDYRVMRRTHSSLMKQAKVDPKLVADQQGHGLDTNQNVYTQTPVASRLEAVETLSAFVN
jgi:hypothetical protein